MEGWGNMTTMREMIKERDSPVMKWSTRAAGVRDQRNTGRQVSNDHSPHVEEQSVNKDVILQQ